MEEGLEWQEGAVEWWRLEEVREEAGVMEEGLECHEGAWQWWRLEEEGVMVEGWLGLVWVK